MKPRSRPSGGALTGAVPAQRKVLVEWEPVPAEGCKTCGALTAARYRSRGSAVTVRSLSDQTGNRPRRRATDGRPV